MNELVLIGAGGHGKVVADAAEKLGYKSIKFFDDDWPDKLINERWPIVSVIKSTTRKCFVSIGNNSKRALLFQDLYLDKCPNIIHPHSKVSNCTQLSSGVFVNAGAIIMAGCEVEEGVIINTGAIIDHDCTIGKFSHVAPGAVLAGGVQVGKGAFIGIGSKIINGIKIGEGATVAAGATVTRDVIAFQTVKGTPAKP